MVYSINNIIIFSITPAFIILSVYLTFKIRIEYRNYEKRTLCTSILCLVYHELYVALVSYSAWYNTWPFFNLNAHLYIHIIISIFGFILMIVGLFFYISYLASMKSVPIAIGRNSNDLITDGIFNVSRNPQSLSRITGLIGIAMVGRSFFTLLLAITFIIINHFNILIEEKHLENKFGESYLHYCSLTPRYCKIKKKC